MPPPCPLSKRVFLTASDSHVENAPETTTTTMMTTMTTCERASVRLHFAEEGQCQEERGKRGDEEIMGVAVGRWSLHGREIEGATSIIPHSGNGQNKEDKSSRS